MVNVPWFPWFPAHLPVHETLVWTFLIRNNVRWLLAVKQRFVYACAACPPGFSWKRCNVPDGRVTKQGFDPE